MARIGRPLGIPNPRAGRKPGSKNKATIQREIIAARIAAETVVDARVTGKKLAKEVLAEFMEVLSGMAAKYQNDFMRGGDGSDKAEEKFRYYAEQTIWCAMGLAKYQSPTFKAIGIVQPPTIAAEPAKQLTGKVIRLDDPVALARVYRSLVVARRR